MTDRFDSERLAPLAVAFADSVKHSWAEHAAHDVIGRLPGDEWIAQRRVPVGHGAEADYLLLGPPGAFCLTVACEGWSPAMVEQLHARGRQLRAFALAGYPDELRCAVFLPLAEGEPRYWSFEGGAAWIVGQWQLERWLYCFSDRGFTREEIAYIRELTNLAIQYRPRPVEIPAAHRG
jgi:hypothetical protein